MATNQARWVRNLLGASEPLVMLGSFQAGSTQAVKRGELLEFTASGTGFEETATFVPLDSDYDMSSGDIAIANEEIKSGDLDGYYEIIVPRPGDVFEYDLASAGQHEVGTAVYFSDSETVTTTAGTNILGHIADQDQYPLKQGHQSEDASPDSGTTMLSTSKVGITIETSNSYWSRLQST